MMASPQHTVRESIHAKLQETGEKDRYAQRPVVCLSARRAGSADRKADVRVHPRQVEGVPAQELVRLRLARRAEGPLQRCVRVGGRGIPSDSELTKHWPGRSLCRGHQNERHGEDRGGGFGPGDHTTRTWCACHQFFACCLVALVVGWRLHAGLVSNLRADVCACGTASVPDDVKAELLRKIQLFISTSSGPPTA